MEDPRDVLNSQGFLWEYTDLVEAIWNGDEGELTADQWVKLADRTRKRFRNGELDYKFSLVERALVEIGVCEGLKRSQLEHVAKLALQIGPQDVPRDEDEPGGRKPYRFQSELRNQPEPDFLIDGLLPEKALVVVYGPPGAGKSFLIMDWSWSLQTGIRWGVMPNLKTRQCQVLYICQEGQGGVPGRIRAWEGSHQKVVGAASRLCWIEDPIFYQGYPEALKIILEAASACEEPPELVVVDTLAASLQGDENSAKDQAAFIGLLEAIKQHLKATVILIHHSRKADSTERGSSFLRGRADVMFMVESTDVRVTLQSTKSKEYLLGEPIYFNLIPVKYDNMKKSSCILHPYVQGAGGDILRHCKFDRVYAAGSLSTVLKLPIRTVRSALRSLEERGLMRNISSAKKGGRSGGRWQRV